MSIFRQYTFDNSFEQVFVSRKFIREFQIALTFARDYDANGAPTNGVFRATWDTAKVTPESVARFRDKYPEVDVKVFISIGNRGSMFPFKPRDPKTWVSNATASLTALVRNPDYDLHVDGIDVLYESIEASTEDFVACVGQLVENLRESGVVSVASISPSFALNRAFYSCLYSARAFAFEWVDYQFQNEATFVFSPNELVDRYNALVKEFRYPRRKLIAGYSAENEDWGTLSPIVFFLGGMALLQKKRGAPLPAPGISIHYHDYYNQPHTPIIN